MRKNRQDWFRNQVLLLLTGAKDGALNIRRGEGKKKIPGSDNDVEDVGYGSKGAGLAGEEKNMVF